MTTVPRGEKVQGRSLTAEARAGELILEAHVGELIPGIADDITVAYITTKLSWRDMYVLSSVSRGWLQAIRSRRVYNARLHHDATETCFLFYFGKDQIYLGSMKDHSVRKLPPIRGRGLVRASPPDGVVAIDGRVYAQGLGGRLHVLDLAGQQEWKPCLTGKDKGPFHSVKFEVMDGKIYALANSSYFRIPRSAYVYDLQQNTWSSIRPMPSMRFQYQVVAVGDELVVYGGEVVTRPPKKRCEFSGVLPSSEGRVENSGFPSKAQGRAFCSTRKILLNECQ
ncbi:unnamed protein product [Calypogeia fissa]